MRAASLGGLATPCLVLDLAVFEANLARMAGRAKAAGKALRPHAKAHKSTEIARRQIAAGAVGLSCVTLREAEVMAQAGVPGLLLTSPVVPTAALERLGRLLAEAPDLMVVADHPTNVAQLEQVAAVSGRTLGVLVDIDVGQGRTGVIDAASAVALAKSIEQAPHLRYAGVQAYYGHLQHVPAYADRLAQARTQWDRLGSTLNALREADLPPTVVSGGGTGSSSLDLAIGPFTEIQPGSYLFMDRQYGAVSIDEAEAGFASALGILAHVVSANQPDCAVIDAGLKAMATEAGPADFLDGVPDGATYKFMGDEHGGVVCGGPGQPLQVGDRVLLRPPHCDPTVNLHDLIHVVEGGRPVAAWRIDARGY
jgi:D-serine deaminase-like pyridoxal phosphate-dependent protein